MTSITGRIRIVLAALLFGFAVCAAAQQATVTTTGEFEILQVQGNTLVVRNADGTHEYTVPSDFPFVVDGSTLTVKDLRAGMRGTATVTTQVTVVPVYVTQVRNGEVLSRIARTIVVKAEDGTTHRFTQTELDERGVQIFHDDKEIRVADLNAGDQISATIVTRGPPEILTEQQVAATLANPEAAAAQAVGTVAAAAAVEAVPAPSAPEEAPRSNWLVWLIAALVLALVVYLVTRRRGQEDKPAGKDEPRS